MNYLDANVFIQAFAGKGKPGDAAREIISDVAKGTEAATATLTVDEVVWCLIREAGRDQAVSQGERMTRIPHLRFVPVREIDVGRSLKLMREFPLSPRDAIHAAVALNENIATIVSTDRDFDSVSGLKRVALPT